MSDKSNMNHHRESERILSRPDESEPVTYLGLAGGHHLVCCDIAEDCGLCLGQNDMDGHAAYRVPELVRQTPIAA
jgi:hypothetical protein